MPIESFWEACECRGPLILEVEEGEGARPVRYAFDRPAILIGSGLGSDLRLEHPDVSRRHAYLQMIFGRPFVVDLDSRTGLTIGGAKSAAGWVVPGRPIAIGAARISVRSGHSQGDERPGPGSNPLSSKGDRSTSRPPTTSLVVDGDDARPIPISRTLTLVGRSPRCKLRLRDPLASRFQVALLRTPGGVWVVDLRSTDGVSVNGVRLNHARLEDGDELRAGPMVARLVDRGSSLAVVRPDGSGGRSPGTDLRPILEQLAGAQDPSSEPFGMMILLLTQMMGTMHRELVDLVREELEQIRRLAAEMQALKADAQAGGRGQLGPPPEEADPASTPKARDPVDVHLFVAERLEAFERERQGHWNRISRILFKSDR
jgi:pSer/pThr/pTyr-binding forkhead associated (FHA) protein